MPQLYAFTTVIEKSFMNGHKPPGTVRIWSAGCSTGEEPYTLAILMMEASARTGRNVPFHVYGTDISSKALASAKRAVFNNYSVRNTDRAILEQILHPEKRRVHPFGQGEEVRQPSIS